MVKHTVKNSKNDQKLRKVHDACSIGEGRMANEGEPDAGSQILYFCLHSNIKYKDNITENIEEKSPDQIYVWK